MGRKKKSKSDVFSVLLSEDEIEVIVEALESRIEMLDAFEDDEEAEAQAAACAAVQKQLLDYID